MTVFEHNKHQVAAVEDVARSVGAIEFEARPSHGEHTVQDGVTISSTDYEYSSKNLTSDVDSMSDQRDFGLWGNIQIDNCASKCPWYSDRRIQIDPWASVWPCCHTSLLGIDYEGVNLEHNADGTFETARTQNSLKHNSLRWILNGDWYNTTVNKAVESASWRVCRESCGVQK
jgi:hypothetical protein